MEKMALVSLEVSKNKVVTDLMVVIRIVFRVVMVMVMMVMMMMMNPAPPSGVSAKAMLTGEEYFPASFFCLRASSS